MTEEDLRKISKDAWAVALGLTITIFVVVFTLVPLL